MKKLIKNTSWWLSAILIGIILGLGLGIVKAWTEPASSPPEGNLAAPINVGSTGQSKSGGLLLNSGGATNGLIVEYGNVGIGTTAPSQKLDVVGYVKGQSGLCIGNDCRSSWPSGQPLSLRQNSCYWTNWGCGQIICPVGYYLVGWDQTSADWCPTSDWEPMRAYCCQP